jgi:hypothetical protein
VNYFVERAVSLAQMLYKIRWCPSLVVGRISRIVAKLVLNFSRTSKISTILTTSYRLGLQPKIA